MLEKTAYVDGSVLQVILDHAIAMRGSFLGGDLKYSQQEAVALQGLIIAVHGQALSRVSVIHTDLNCVFAGRSLWVHHYLVPVGDYLAS